MALQTMHLQIDNTGSKIGVGFPYLLTIITHLGP
jgi:hypothetical protein